MATPPCSTFVPVRRLTGTPKLSPRPAQSTGSHRQRGSSATQEQRAQRGQILAPGSSSEPGSPYARNCTATSNPAPHHSPPAARILPAAPGKSPGGCGSSLRLLAKPKACPACPLCHVRQPCKTRNVPLPGKHVPFKRHACAVSRVRNTLAAGTQEIRDTMVHLGHSALPAKIQQEALAVGRNITGEGMGESRLLNIQHATSSSATATR